ncbi:helix-turn-helix domain-containing protein [Paenibacillus sp. V4I5]|uniref:helix-turn-helix domain-containing protein n=1 Tax=Paenibacillus sp. V4I5 TaxID=3042306 RepID=UPI002792C378|nr:helix-turn-helix domain-containing protein [Paenibacillus sp. V4I5]MDQ0915969.1 AraC family transcriptional regulator [Paenibacillus sp. V4I5]
MIGKLQIRRYYFGKQREQFSLSEDTYEGWGMLAAQSGRFSFTLEGDEQGEQIAEFGELVFCQPGQTLRRLALEPISFHFAEFTLDSSWTLPGKIRIKDVGRLSSTFQYMQEWQEAEDHGNHQWEVVHHLIEDLLFMANREQLTAQRKQSGTSDPLMNQAAAYIEMRAFEHELSLQALAVTLGIGASQLTRRFQAAYGMSPIRYATKVRLSRARLLLAETPDTLDAIAEQCGFQNAFYFSRVFSQHMQISPSAYRRTFRV